MYNLCTRYLSKQALIEASARSEENKLDNRSLGLHNYVQKL